LKNPAVAETVAVHHTHRWWILAPFCIVSLFH